MLLPSLRVCVPSPVQVSRCHPHSQFFHAPTGTPHFGSAFPTSPWPASTSEPCHLPRQQPRPVPFGHCRLLDPELASRGQEAHTRIGTGARTAHLCPPRLIPFKKFKRSGEMGMRAACGRGLRISLSSPTRLLNWCGGAHVDVYFSHWGVSRAVTIHPWPPFGS